MKNKSCKGRFSINLENRPLFFLIKTALTYYMFTVTGMSVDFFIGIKQDDQLVNSFELMSTLLKVFPLLFFYDNFLKQTFGLPIIILIYHSY